MRAISFSLLVATLIAGCQASPRQRPVELGPVNTGPGSLEAERKRFEGRWSLERFEVIEKGQATPVKAQAVLTLDAYGNIDVKGEVQGPLPGQTPTARVEPLLQYSGRIEIDQRTQVFRLRAPEGDIDPAIKARIDPNEIRKYEFIGADQLRISFVDANGQPTASTLFRKAP